MHFFGKCVYVCISSQDYVLTRAASIIKPHMSCSREKSCQNRVELEARGLSV